MRKLILRLLSFFTVGVLAADPVPAFKRTWAAPMVKVAMSRTKKRQMNVYYARQDNKIDDSESDTGADDLDIHVGYRRPQLAYDAAVPGVDTIPDHILKRLEIARRRAVARHQELWS